MFSIGTLVIIFGKNVVWHEGADEQFFDSLRALSAIDKVAQTCVCKIETKIYATNKKKVLLRF